MTVRVTLNLDDETAAALDAARGDTSRAAWINRVLEHPAPDVVDQILDDAVRRATQAYRSHRPGQGEFVLTRAAMAVQHLEELRG